MRSTRLALIGSDLQPWLDHVAAQPLTSSQHPVLLVDAATAPALLASLPALCRIPPPAGWPDQLAEGFHPLALGPIPCLLCVGDMGESLAELVCTAQALWVAPVCMPWLAQATGRQLARRCTRGAVLTVPSDAGASVLDGLGFIPSGSCGEWSYQPRWPAPDPVDPAPSSALVVGAGLAGAAVALSLVERGWQVHLLDQHAGPAEGASALPVGVMTEHRAAHDTVLCELSRVGVPLHWRELHARLPKGQGWQAAPVANLKPFADGPLSDLPSLGSLLTDLALAPLLQPGGLIRPAALVQAWLDAARTTGRLTEHWWAPVSAVAPSDAQSGTWMATDANGQVLAQAAHVVLAAAHGSLALLAPHSPQAAVDWPLRPVKGQMTCGVLHGAPLAPCPVRHNGVFVPVYEDAAHPVSPRLWSMGSTYERGQDNAEVTPASHQRNAASLQALCPEAHTRLFEQAPAGEVFDWAEVRCASLDRLPLVGPVLAHPADGLKPSATLAGVPRTEGLWTLSALGSRGLTLSLLAGQLLAARMAGGPWPMKRRHAEALDPARFALRQARKAEQPLNARGRAPSPVAPPARRAG